MTDEQLHEQIVAILNNPRNYEYEGLSWSAVEDLRELLEIPPPKGAWLA